MSKGFTHIGSVFIIVSLCGCFDDESVSELDSSWNVVLESSPIDSCFDRPVTAQGAFLEGEIEGRSIWMFTNHPNNVDVFYYVSKENSTSSAELFQLDFCNGEEVLLDNFSSFMGNTLEVNRQEKIVCIDLLGHVVLYDIPTKGKTELEDVVGVDVAWLGDSVFLCRQFIDINTTSRPAWVSYTLDGVSVDTLLQSDISSVSNLNGNLIALNTTSSQENENRFYLYDVEIADIVSEHTFPRLNMNTSRFSSFWIDEGRIIIRTASTMGLYDLTTNEFITIRDDSECDNYSFSGIAASTNQSNEFLYLVRQNRYNDFNEYKLSYDLVRYNLETQEEVKVVF